MLIFLLSIMIEMGKVVKGVLDAKRQREGLSNWFDTIKLICKTQTYFYCTSNNLGSLKFHISRKI